MFVDWNPYPGGRWPWDQTFCNLQANETFHYTRRTIYDMMTGYEEVIEQASNWSCSVQWVQWWMHEAAELFQEDRGWHEGVSNRWQSLHRTNDNEDATELLAQQRGSLNPTDTMRGAVVEFCRWLDDKRPGELQDQQTPTK